MVYKIIDVIVDNIPMQSHLAIMVARPACGMIGQHAMPAPEETA